MRWIGCAAVWEAGRAVCGERRLEQTQGYSPTATEDDGVGRGDIHTYAIVLLQTIVPSSRIYLTITSRTSALPGLFASLAVRLRPRKAPVARGFQQMERSRLR